MTSISELKVIDIMSREIRHVAPDCLLSEAARQMADGRISSLLVLSEGHLAGILTEHDVVRFMHDRVAADTPVSRLMSAPVLTASADLDFASAYTLAMSRHVRHLVVTGAAGEVVGMVSETDFRSHLGLRLLRQLDNLTAIMEREMPLLTEDASLDEGLKLMVHKGASYVLVVDAGRHPLGIVTERDMPSLLSRATPATELPMRTVMHGPVQVVDRRASFTEAAGRMFDHHLRHLAVVDETGAIIGMLTQHRLLEQIGFTLVEDAWRNLVASQEALLRSEENLNRAQAVARTGSWYLNIQAGRLEWSAETYRMFGVEPDMPMTLDDLIRRILPDDREPVLVAWDGALHGEPFDVEHRILVDGEVRWVQERAELSFDPDGRPLFAVGTVQDVTDLRLARQQVEFMAHHDALTRLPNRILARDRFEQAVTMAAREGRKVALLFLDLDNFKTINDTLGHQAGDHLLQQVVGRLAEAVRGSDTISRQGGDEFLVILTALPDENGADAVAQHILEDLARPFVVDGHELHTSASIGISVYPDDGAEFDTLLKRADMAMYSAKEFGRATYRFFTEEMNRHAFERLQMQNRLRHALDESEFLLHYQPQVDLKSGRLLGVEALLRWQSKELGMVAPGRFVPVAEESGLIMPIGTWVLREACRQARAWRDELGLAIPVGVNLSALQFRRGSLVATVAEVLDETGLEPGLLELELTETMLLHDTEAVRAAMDRIRALGVQMSIDDFGTGYSSLSYLKRLPVTRLKIDQSFVRDMIADDDDGSIVRAIIQMAHSLKLTVIAEGVETAEQGAWLAREGCDQAQGYHYGRPMPAEAVAARFARRGETARAAAG
ncbi:EAL domain-containing protein [Parasulfuritortus cantonensis]|nr:EAL domain-containing protein [Parasulfuritortus cantonensis]